jgi:octaprenyl-diphosphate synthase
LGKWGGLQNVTIDDKMAKMNLKEIQEPIKGLLEETNAILKRVVTSNVSLVKKMSHHTPTAKGKRIRSTLLFLLAGMNNSVTEDLPAIAAAIELFHLSSLIHDDVVDNSNYRRGEKTLNVNFGNHVSVLWGDFLFISSLFSLNKIHKNFIMDIILEAALLMIEGQLIEIENHLNTNIKQKTYTEIIQKKTSSLFAGVSQIASAVNGAPEARARQFYDFGLNFGTIFQISDDIIDIFSEKSGKDRFRDLREGKITLPIILLLKKSRKDVVKNLQEMDERQFLELLKEQNIKGLSLKEIDRYHKACSEFILQFPDSVYRQAMQNLLAFIQYREY